MEDFFVDFTVLVLVLFGTSVIGFGMALLWFRTVGREVDREAVLLAAKIFGGIFVGGILFFLAKKFF